MRRRKGRGKRKSIRVRTGEIHTIYIDDVVDVVDIIYIVAVADAAGIAHIMHTSIVCDGAVAETVVYTVI